MSAPARPNPDQPNLAPAEAPTETKKGSPAPIVVGVIGCVVLVYIIMTWLSGRHYESTDDAYVTADIVQIGSEVKGTLTALKVKDNEAVKAGEEIATVDSAQYEINLQQAQANLASAEAAAGAAGADVDLTRSQGMAQIMGAQGGKASAQGAIGSALAQVDVLRAQLRSSEASALVAHSEVENLRRDIDSATDTLKRATAQVRSAQAGVANAEASSRAANAAVQSATANLDLAQKQFNRAQSLLGEGVVSQRDYDQADTALQSATAGLDQAKQQWSASKAMIDQRQADLQTAEANLSAARTGVAQAKTRQREGVDRYNAAQAAAAAQAASVEAARSAASTAQGSLVQSQANVHTAGTLPEKIKQKNAQRALALAQVKQAQVAVANAELDLSRTHIRAQVNGIVSKRYAQVGTLLQVGSPVASIVPEANLYIVANFKETQVARMAAGQEVEIGIDGFGGHVFHGRVDSVSAATGSQFALIPPDNATGNFVKVVQRVPVKIVIQADDLTPKIAAGMSADVKVKVLD